MNNVPTTIPLTFKGEPVTLSPLSLNDASELASFMRDGYMAESLRQIQKIDDTELKQFAYLQAKASSDLIQPGRKEFDKAFQTPENLSYFFFISLRKGKPGITYKECRDYLNDNYAEVMGKLNEAAGMKEAPLATGETNPQTKA